MSSLIGGLGLLLIGMSLMTEGLKLASGSALRDILALWTNTRLRGLFSGFLITGVVQSSSAVTVATIGFANAGMLTLERAVWVIYGSNVGTTMTAWIVALIGFQVDIEALALPLVGLGAVLKFTGGRSRRSSLGMALVGFGLLFLGIDFLKDAFTNIGDSFTLPAFDDPGFWQLALYVLIGFALTTLMQSSSAAMVITLSAAQSGLIPLQAAAAVVIGANLGTTTTALLSVIGATPTAKRVALSHVTFNLLTAAVAIFILSPMLWVVQTVELRLDIVPEPALTLAIFHTLFNILGILLIWPVSRFLVDFLRARFKTSDETEALPRHLDKTVLALPFIATDALALEVSRVNHHAINAFRESLDYNLLPPNTLNEALVVRTLSEEIVKYCADLSRTELTAFLTDTMAKLLESTQQYLLVIDIAEDIASLSRSSHDYVNLEVQDALEAYIACISRHLAAQDLATPELNRRGNDSYDDVERYYRRLKDAVLRAASHGHMKMEQVDRLLQYMNQAKRGCRQILKATQRLLDVRDALQRDQAGNVVPTAERSAEPAAADAQEDTAAAASEPTTDDSTGSAVTDESDSTSGVHSPGAASNNNEAISLNREYAADKDLQAAENMPEPQTPDRDDKSVQ